MGWALRRRKRERGIGASLGWGALLALALAWGDARAATRYVTTPSLELDRCATAWAIRTYVEPAASFEFHDEDEFPEDAIPFDLPNAALRRDARRATLEVLIAREGLDDPFVLRLGRLVHEAEIGAWARAADAPSLVLEHRVMDAVYAAPDLAGGLAACFAALDALRAETEGGER